MKDFNTLLEAAFMAGVATGAGYPALEAIPPGVTENAYQAWRGRWAGRPHEGLPDATCDSPGTRASSGTHSPACFAPGGHAHRKPGHYDVSYDTAVSLGMQVGGQRGD